MSDHAFLQRILLACSRGSSRLFRNNVGLGWVGKSTRIEHAGTIAVNCGDVVIRNARPLHAGLQKGSGDLIGWKIVTVTPGMVGARIAQFVSIEAKNAGDAMRSEQKTWRDQVNSSGGISIEARSVDDAQRALNDHP